MTEESQQACIRSKLSKPREPQTEEQRLGDGRLPQVMEHEEIPPNARHGVGSGSSSEEEVTPLHPAYAYQSANGYTETETPLTYTPQSSIGAYTPSNGLSSGFSSWNSYQPRPRGGSGGGGSNGGDRGFPLDGQNMPIDPRLARPGAPLRTPSNTYQPQRRPPHIPSLSSRRMHSSSSTNIRSRRDPNAQYKAQEKAYVNTVRRPQMDWIDSDFRAPSFAYSTDSASEDESPSTEQQIETDPYDPETQLFLGAEEYTQPTEDDLKVPESRERLEWHAMLASVLKGDVVRQEKQRLIGTTESKTRAEIGKDVWMGVRAKYYGRNVMMQKRLIEDARQSLTPLIEDIITFEIKGETVVGKSPTEQVHDVVAKISKCEWLYPSRNALEEAQPRAASESYQASCDAIISWNNITTVISTEIGILQQWVGNPELDFTKSKKRSGPSGELADESSFIDRILKEDGLKPLQDEKKSLLDGVAKVIRKSKLTLIENAELFVDRHLPPYIEELLTLINFPTRLIQEIIRIRLNYAKKMKESAQTSGLIIDQMIDQFQILMTLACRIKQEYLSIAHPEPGWDLPPCIDDAFDSVVLDALKFYFKMLNWKLGTNKNTFREAEILEQEWEFSNSIGRQLEGGDIEVAEQFSSLTAKALARLTTYFERELREKPDESSADMEKRYKTILDSVRVRQRKLFRFSRLLRQRFENATEFNLGMNSDELQTFCDSLNDSGHFLVASSSSTSNGVYFLASPSLWSRPKDIHSILGTSFRADDAPEDPSNPYILLVRPETSLTWEGQEMELDALEAPSDVRVGRLRLVADGSEQRLQHARLDFTSATHRELDVAIEQRANLSRVNVELGRIKKTTFKLSNTIMESVELVRTQNNATASTELVQSCFAFATEFGKRSLQYMDHNRRLMNNLKLTRLALDWISFVCDDCDAADRRTFKWAVVAIEFAMMMTRGTNVLAISDDEYNRMRLKVAGCMSVLISHFDIMGARSTLAAQQEKNRSDANAMQKRLDIKYMKNDEEACKYVAEQRCAQLGTIDCERSERETIKPILGKVLEGSDEADRSLTFLSSTATNVTMRWQQGMYVGGGSFGSVYAAINLDTGNMMAVKEIRLQDPQLIPTIVKQIGDEMGVLAVLDHPNVVSYYGIEVHRDKVYIFMEYCSGGSVAGLLEHGRIEDETVIMVYALQMLEGLAYLHQANIVHRDIKPENVLLDHNGLIKYVDFGAAKIIARQGQTIMAPEPRGKAAQTPGEHKEAAANAGGAGAAAPRMPQGTMTGTPMYMSPEVIRGDSPGSPLSPTRFSGAADIWSLGCVVLEMSTGRRPWSHLDNEWAIMYNIAQGNPPALPTADQLSETGLDFLRRCFEREPAKRSTAAELLQHPWMKDIRQMVVEGQSSEPDTPRSETGMSTITTSSSNGSWGGHNGMELGVGHGERQNSMP